MHVLFVEDDEVVAQNAQMALRALGHDCEITDLGATALALSKRKDYDIVVLDVGLPDMDGFKVVRRMKLEGVKTPLLMQSGLDDPSLPSTAESLGVANFLVKPFSIAELLERMEAVLGISEPAEPEPAPDAETAPPPPPKPQAPAKSAGTIRAQSAEPAAPAAPVERPSAIAVARQALRNQPAPPSRLRAASEALAERSAKALSKAKSGAKALSSTTESGVKVFSKVVTKARSVVGPKDGGEARPRSEPAPPSRLRAASEALAERSAKALSMAESGAKALSSTTESGAKVFSKLVTKARSVVGPKDGGETRPRSEPELAPEAEPAVPCDPEPAPNAEPAAESAGGTDIWDTAESQPPAESVAEPEGAKEPEAAVHAGLEDESVPEVEPDPEPDPEPENSLAAGGGFISAEVVEKDGAERRRHERRKVIEASVIADGISNIPCVILNLSESGAMLLVSSAELEVPESFVLRSLNGEEHNCMLRWRDADKIGLEFT